MRELRLDGTSLELREAAAASLGPIKVTIEDAARARVQKARDHVEALVASRETVYGITTGFGRLKNVVIPPENAGELQRNLLRSHAVGVGRDAHAPVVRLLLLLRLNTLLRGHSGVKLATVDALIRLLERDILPRVPVQGSVGACGDLAPLAHLALVLIGEGEAHVEGQLVSGAKALEKAGLQPLDLGAKEGLALINGVQFSAATGLLAWERADRLARTADVACALTVEALMGSASPFHPRVAGLRGHPGHAEVAENITALLQGSEILGSHHGCDRVQDPYSLRCAPQVHGAVRDALRHLAEVLRVEINSVTDNPLLFPDEGLSVSAGNFHGEPLVLPLDYAKAALSELGSISERRIENLVNPDLSRLPAFLAGGEPGLHSGLMMAQVTAAALVSENKGLAHPASVDSIPTSANQEDHVSMSPIAARQLERIATHVENVLAIEFLSASHAIHWRRPLRTSARLEAALARIGQEVPGPGEDRAFGQDIAKLRELILSEVILGASTP